MSQSSRVPCNALGKPQVLQARAIRYTKLASVTQKALKIGQCSGCNGCNALPAWAGNRDARALEVLEREPSQCGANRRRAVMQAAAVHRASNA